MNVLFHSKGRVALAFIRLPLQRCSFVHQGGYKEGLENPSHIHVLRAAVVGSMWMPELASVIYLLRNKSL